MSICKLVVEGGNSLNGLSNYNFDEASNAYDAKLIELSDVKVKYLGGEKWGDFVSTVML